MTRRWAADAVLRPLVRQTARRVGHQRGEGGTTLVELLITVVILGTAFTALLGAIANGMFTSDVNRKQAQSADLLRSYAESVDYVRCTPPAGPAPTPQAPVSIPAGFNPVVTVTHLNAAGTAFVAGCPSPDTGIELFTVSVGSTDQRATESVSVIKRDLLR